MVSLNQLAQFALAPVSDKTFGKLQYFRNHGRFPNLEEPGTFNEKIQWLKAYYRNPLLKTCADKYTVRAYVGEKAGKDHLIPLLGVYESADAVDFPALPSRFVLKASHGSGWNLLCRDKRVFDAEAAREAMRAWLKADFYKVGREWSYQGLRPRIVCEEFLSDPSGEPPWDYKFFCFHGEPRYVQVDYARFRAHTRGIYSTDWERLPCMLEYALATEDSPPPRTLGKMLEVARRLAEPFPFVRVDLYELGERVYFGEMTFYPGKGVERFSPPEFDRTFGEWLDIANLPRSRSDGAE